MTKPVKVLLGFLLVLFAGNLVYLAVGFLLERQNKQHAEAWLHDAEQFSRPDLTKQEVIKWLYEQGAELVVEGRKKNENRKETCFNAIWACQTMGKNSWWVDPMTAVLLFHFDENWKFTRIQMEIRDGELMTPMIRARDLF